MPERTPAQRRVDALAAIDAHLERCAQCRHDLAHAEDVIAGEECPELLALHARYDDAGA